MTDVISNWTNDIHNGDAADTLAEMPESSVHMMMTSPPYFGLRDYGVDGQIGLEESLDEYINELVEVFQEVRRVLRPDGSAWLNLGDSYAGSGRGSWEDPTDEVKESYVPSELPDRNDRLGRKNKMLVPHRVAIALQDDGWIVRNDVTWAKPNPMPSSVKDRLNTTTEKVFHLVPEPDYWYDLDAIREPYSASMERRKDCQSKHGGHEEDGWGGGNHHDGGLLDDTKTYGDTMHPAGKNPGDVFEVTTKPFPEAHFAVYPPELVEKPLKATCPPKVCAECGSPYDRDVEREPGEYDYSKRSEQMRGDCARTQSSGTQLSTAKVEHKGWDRTCDCDTDATKAGIVVDPFAGAGTTCMVGKRHGRRFIGIDLNEEYVAMAQKRVGVDVSQPEILLDENETSLAAYADGGQYE